MLAELSYYRRRASEERTAAIYARHAAVRRVHVELAERYEERVRGIVGHSDGAGIAVLELSSPQAHQIASAVEA